MNAEIDAEADEQDCERNRHQVEMANRQRRESGGPDQSANQRGENAQNKPQRPDSPGEQNGDQNQAYQPGIGRTVFDAFQFLGGYDDAAG